MRSYRGAAVNINVFRCFLKAESELQIECFTGDCSRQQVPSKKKNAWRNQWSVLVQSAEAMKQSVCGEQRRVEPDAR